MSVGWGNIWRFPYTGKNITLSSNAITDANNFHSIKTKITVYFLFNSITKGGATFLISQFLTWERMFLGQFQGILYQTQVILGQDSPFSKVMLKKQTILAFSF